MAELAEQIRAGAGPAGIAALARQVLEVAEFEPGFELEPALLAVADDLQDAVMEARFTVWPECPAHGLGAHAREHHGTPVWWCNGGGGHRVAAIGELGR